MPVSLRVPVDMVKRIAKLAGKRETSPHAFMIEAIAEKLEAEETQAAFHAEAQLRLTNMKKTGNGIAADKVFDYLRARSRGEKASRPKARRLS